MAAHDPASPAKESHQHEDVEAQAGPSSSSEAPGAVPFQAQRLGKHTALLLLAYGRDGLVFLISTAAKLLWRSVGSVAALALQHKDWLVRAPLAVLQLLARLVRLIVYSPVAKALVAVAARIASLQLSVGSGGQEERDDGSVKASVRLSSYLSLLFGTLRLRTHTSLQLATPSLRSPLVPACSAASPTPHSRRAGTNPAAAASSCGAGGQQEVHLLCSRELKHNILAFLNEQSTKNGQGYVLLRSASGGQQDGSASAPSTPTCRAPPAQPSTREVQSSTTHGEQPPAAERASSSMSETWAEVVGVCGPSDATAKVSSSRPARAYSSGHSGVRSSLELFEALAAGNAAPNPMPTSNSTAPLPRDAHSSHTNNRAELAESASGAAAVAAGSTRSTSLPVQRQQLTLSNAGDGSSSSSMGPEQRAASLPTTPNTALSDDDSIIAAPAPALLQEPSASLFMPPLGYGRASPIAFPARHGVNACSSRKPLKAPLPPPPFAAPALLGSSVSGRGGAQARSPPVLVVREGAAAAEGPVLVSPGSGGLRGLLGVENGARHSLDSWAASPSQQQQQQRRSPGS